MYNQAERPLCCLYIIELLVQFVNAQPACLHACLIILNLNVTHTYKIVTWGQQQQQIFIYTSSTFEGTTKQTMQNVSQIL